MNLHKLHVERYKSYSMVESNVSVRMLKNRLGRSVRITISHNEGFHHDRKCFFVDLTSEERDEIIKSLCEELDKGELLELIHSISRVENKVIQSRPGMN